MASSKTSVKTSEASNLDFKRNEWTKVSVIIPVYNNAEGLKDTLTALKQQTYPKENLEIIVVDNNSNDGSNKVALETEGVNLLYEREIQNAGAARNKGLSVATGSVIAFTDADCVPDKNWLKEGVTQMQQLEQNIIGGQIIIHPLTLESSPAALLDAICNFNQEFAIKNYHAATTANLFIRSHVFKSVGKFDPEQLIEDIEFGRRAYQSGFELIYIPNSIIYHPPRDTFKKVWIKSRRSGRGVFSLCLKEKIGGWMGWKYPARIVRILVFPRQLHWERLPFSPSQISWQKRLQIYILLWMAVNFAEAIGYTEWGFRHLRQQFIKMLKSLISHKI